MLKPTRSTCRALSSDIPLNGVEAGFGVFYNALDWKGVRGFLKLGLQTEINQLPVEPVPVDSLGRLRELIGLLYGDSTRNLKPAIRESRDLSKLSQVLGDEVSTANLQRDRDLERAWRVSGGGKPSCWEYLRTFTYVWQWSTGKPENIPTTKISGVVSGASVIS